MIQSPTQFFPFANQQIAGFSCVVADCLCIVIVSVTATLASPPLKVAPE